MTTEKQETKQPRDLVAVVADAIEVLHQHQHNDLAAELDSVLGIVSGLAAARDAWAELQKWPRAAGGS